MQATQPTNLDINQLVKYKSRLKCTKKVKIKKTLDEESVKPAGQ